MNEIKQLQLDTKSMSQWALLQDIISSVESLDLSQDEYLSLSSFKDWNGRFDRDSKEAYRYMVFYIALVNQCLDLPNTKDRIHVFKSSGFLPRLVGDSLRAQPMSVQKNHTNGIKRCEKNKEFRYYLGVIFTE